MNPLEAHHRKLQVRMSLDHPLCNVCDVIHALLLDPAAQENKDASSRHGLEVAIALTTFFKVRVCIQSFLGNSFPLNKWWAWLGTLVFKHGVIQSHHLWQWPENPVFDLGLLRISA